MFIEGEDWDLVVLIGDYHHYECWLVATTTSSVT